MIYATIDVKIRDHWRVQESGLNGLGMWLWGMLYCHEHETDGVIPKRAAFKAVGSRGAAAAVQKLISSGLWIEMTDHFKVHNYEAKNQTKSQIQKKKLDAAARKAKWVKEHQERVPNGSENTAITNTITNRSPSPSEQIERESQPKVEVGGKVRRLATRTPSSDAQPSEVSEWMARWHIPEAHPEAIKMLDHFRGTGELKLDWGATWRNWERRAPEFGGKARGRVVQQAPATGSLYQIGMRNKEAGT